MKACHYCGTDKEDLRPYGPNHSYVCFKCAFETPERAKEAENNFVTQLLAVNGPVVIGTDAGPIPLENSGINMEDVIIINDARKTSQ